MVMVCPQCGLSYDQRLQCPNCNVRLHFQEQSRSGRGGSAWLKSPWGRVLLGLLLSQGLYWGLRHLSAAILLGIWEEEPAAFWSTLGGVILAQGLQLLGLVVGGMIAGAGQSQGWRFGGVLGLFNGALSILFQPEQAALGGAVAIYGTPLLHGGTAALLGWLGATFWPALPTVEVSGGQGPKPSPKKVALSRLDRSLFDGPIVWWRVAIGSIIAVAGTLLASTILDLVSSDGKRIETYTQEKLLTGEIIALAILAGGALAGATTRNGLKQGLAVGITTSVLLTGILLGQTRFGVDIFFLTSLSAVILGMVGGGFGSQMVPPLVPQTVSDSPLC